MALRLLELIEKVMLFWVFAYCMNYGMKNRFLKDVANPLVLKISNISKTAKSAFQEALNWLKF